MKILSALIFHCLTAATVWHGGPLAMAMLFFSLILAHFTGFIAGEECDLEPNE